MVRKVNFWELPVEDAQQDDTVPAYRGRGQVARVRLAAGGGGKGTVTSVAVSMPAGFQVAGSPVTSSGTIAVTFAEGYGLPTTVAMGQWSAAYSWGNHALAGYALATDVTAGLSGKVDTSDARLTNAREWTGATIAQAEAEAGVATTRRAWTAQRVRQAIAAWWAGTTDKIKLDGIQAGATANATDAQLRDRATHTGTQAMSTVEGLETALDGKVGKQTGYGLSQSDFTPAEKAKLAALEGSRFKGVFASLAALQTGVPSPAAGDYADVDAPGQDVSRYIWDASDAEWVKQSGEVAPLTAAQVKGLYEANPDTNAFTDAERTKLQGVAAGATANKGTVTSVQVAVPTGLQVAGGPVTTSGTLTISYQTGYSIPANNKQTQWDTAYGWGNHASAGYATQSALTSGLSGKVDTSDSRLADSREWTAATVGQAEAEAGTATTRRAWTAQRVRQAILGWWTGSTDKAKLDGIAAGATANTGTVTSVQLAVPTGLQVSGGPVTTSGTITVSYANGYGIPTTTKQGQWDQAYGWGNHASAGYVKPAAMQAYTYSKIEADERIADAIEESSGGLLPQEFRPARLWEFDLDGEGWVANGVTMSVSNGELTYTPFKSDPYISRSGLGIAGAMSPIFRMRLKRTTGADTSLQVFYSTPNHGFQEANSARQTLSLVNGEYQVIELNMADWGDWSSSTITSLRLDIGQTGESEFVIDWISIGSVTLIVPAAAWKETTQTLIPNDFNSVDFSTPRTLVLPLNPAENDYVAIIKTAGTTVGSTISRNGSTIMGLAENLTLDGDISYLRLDYVKGSWRIAS